MKKNRFTIILLTVLAVMLIFWRLDTAPLADWDEGLYSNIAGEIARSGNWTQLILQGQPWLDKEPLGFWLMAASVKLFGFSAWALRLPAALASLALSGLFFVLARRRQSHHAAIILTGLFFLCPLLWQPHWLQTADLDMLGLTFALAAVVSYLHTRAGRWWWLTGIFLAASLLTRGVWGGVYVAFIFIIEWLRPRFGLDRWPTAKIFTTAGITLAPWLAWHAFLWWSYGALYLRIYWQEQFLARLTSGVDNHAQGPLFYVQFMATHLGWPLVIILFASAALIIWHAWRTRDWWLTALAVWFGLTFVPTELMTTKLWWYTALFIVPLWLCLGVLYTEYATTRKIKIIFAAGAILIFARELLFFSVRAQNRTPNATQEFLQKITLHIPPGAPLVVDGVQTWNFGRLLPAWYWYMHYERGWVTYSIDASVRARYFAERDKFRWWIVNTGTKKSVEVLAAGTDFTSTTVGPYILISFPTSTR